jgi:hypothetical protein
VHPHAPLSPRSEGRRIDTWLTIAKDSAGSAHPPNGRSFARVKVDRRNLETNACEAGEFDGPTAKICNADVIG